MIASITFKLPESLRDQIDEVVEEKGYQNKSEFVRSALRDKIEEDLIKVRMDDEAEYMTVSEFRENLSKSLKQYRDSDEGNNE